MENNNPKSEGYEDDNESNKDPIIGKKFFKV